MDRLKPLLAGAMLAKAIRSENGHEFVALGT